MGVSNSDIIASNSSLSSANPTGPTAVFVGGTAGIGLGALQALAKHTNTPTIYIVGRSSAKLEALISELKTLNSKGVYIPIIAKDLTRIRDAQKAAAEIAGQAKQVDLMILTAGYVTFAGREEHPEEGVDKLTAVRYYSRMAFVIGLKDALQASPAARVISVLAGGMEGVIWKDDMLLREKDHFGVVIAGGAASSMTSLLFEKLSTEDGWGKVVFAHIYPGMVSTGLEISGLGVIGNFLIKWLARPIMWAIGYTYQEAGERVLFVGTSGRFRRLEGENAEGSLVNQGSNGKVGSGVYLVQGNTGIVAASKDMVKLREEGMAEVVYSHTMEVFEKIGKGERA